MFSVVLRCQALAARIVLAALFAASCQRTDAAPPLQAPVAGVGAIDVSTQFHLPAIKDGPADPLWASAHTLQVFARASKLGLNSHSAFEAWTAAAETFRRAQAVANQPAPKDPILFRGARASALNALLATPGGHAVRLASSILWVDTPIKILGADVHLDLGHAKLFMSSNGDYLIRIQHAQNVSVSGGVLQQGSWGVLVADSHDVALVDMTIAGLAGGGMLVTRSDRVTLWHNQLRDLGGAPVILHGGSSHVTVARNVISRNRGNSNWDAGVVLTDRNADPAVSPDRLITPGEHVASSWQPMIQRLTIPHDNVIADNQLTGALSSGIYSDGSERNVMVGNRIAGNSKEGICLDNGSTANIVALNTILGNGRRWGKSNEELKREYVFGAGRLPDGTSVAKLPAISVDNAAYNQIVFNDISGNYGGGVKMVRTGYYNLVGMNTISDNNLGQSPKAHFFGIELGAATADAPVPDLDFTPSRGNIIFQNVISGNHYAGIFFGDGSDSNTVLNNAILGATTWAMESVRLQPNTISGNTTDLASRNIDHAP
jgi:parallel beta-helix repeat protein